MLSIKEAIGKSLFLFGAGASYDAGCKMSSGMLSALKEEIVKDSTSIFNSPQKEALKFLLSCLDYHNTWRSFETNNKFVFTPNIEELALLIRRVKNRENFLPYPITGNWADKLSSLESEYKRISNNGALFESLDSIIKQDLLSKWLRIDEDNLSFLDPLREMFENSATEDFSLDLFTLNNDLVIEKYFQKHGMNPFRGFNNNEWRGMENEDSESHYVKIKLYKLHGSIDWVRLHTGEVKEEDKCTEMELEMIDEKHKPYVIFGHGTKTFSVDPFFSLIHNFHNALEEKDYFFVIGYSFFDPYINNLLIESANKGNKKIIIVNPNFGPPINYSKNEELKFEEAVDNNGRRVSSALVDYIEAIQNNPFYSELPEFNFNKINGEDSIAYYKIGTADFFKHFFSNNAKEFIALISKFEENKLREIEPF